MVRSVRRQALGRHWKHLAKERLEDVTPALPLGAKFWALADEEKSALGALSRDPAVSQLVLDLKRREGEEVRLVDAAYWMKGCSSLGKPRFAALLEVAGQGKVKGRIALVDIREGVAAAAPAAVGADVPAHHG